MSVENIGSQIPEFKYHPTASSLNDVVARDLNLDEEVAEVSHLKYDLGYITTDLMQQAKILQSHELQIIVGLVASCDLSPQDQELMLHDLKDISYEKAKELIKIAKSYKDAKSKSRPN